MWGFAPDLMTQTSKQTQTHTPETRLDVVRTQENTDAHTQYCIEHNTWDPLSFQHSQEGLP